MFFVNVYFFLQQIAKEMKLCVVMFATEVVFSVWDKKTLQDTQGASLSSAFSDTLLQETKIKAELKN